MRAMGRILGLGLAAALAAQAAEVVVESEGAPGRLTFGEVPDATGYRAEWATSPAGPWNNTWDILLDLPAVGTGTVTAYVPIVYRVVATIPDPAEGDYLVIDLSAGSEAGSYPVAYLKAPPPGGWTDEYKTTSLVLRRIPAGTFVMGSPDGEMGKGFYEYLHEVTLTRDFYIGVFEVTQKQWERVMGTWPSYYANEEYRDSRPVERVSYYHIRENGDNTPIDPNWPQSAEAGPDSFMGKLRAKTGLGRLDLPTESQWEYACRAGTATALNSGHNLTDDRNDPRMAEVGRYWYNGGSGYTPGGTTAVATAKAGSYQPNTWGLYDMHGNVWEWCLDRMGEYPGTATDPVGAASGLNRVKRGGSWYDYSKDCRSAHRSHNNPSLTWDYNGFRVARTLP